MQANQHVLIIFLITVDITHMNISKTIFVGIILLCFAPKLFAAHYYRNVEITAAGIYGQNGKSILFINISGDKSGMPGCASTGRLAINSDAPQFKDLVSIALSAYALNDLQVDVHANDTCEYFGNAEDILGIKMGAMPW